MAQVQRFMAAGKEIWFTTSKTGTRMAWYYSINAGRAVRVNVEAAELAISMGVSTEGTKPGWVGKK